nr:zinc finger, CCHC-type [Tanacetum cinerariifolium]
MAGNTVKVMTTNFGKLDKFKGHDFRRWNKKMHFLLTTLKVVYVLTTLMPELMEDSTVEAIRIRTKPVMKQYNELLRILRQYTQNGLKMDESISVSSIIDKFPPSWKDFKYTLKHGKNDLSLVQLGSHLCIEESLRAQDSNKGKGKEVVGPSVNMKKGVVRLVTSRGITVVVIKRTTQMLVVRERGLRTNPKTKVDAIAWWIDSGATTHVCKDHSTAPVLNNCGYKQVYESDKYILSKSGVFVGFGYYNNGHVHYKRMLELFKDDLIPAIDENPKMYYLAMVGLPDPKRKTLGEQGIDCIFVGYVEYSKAYRFYVIERNDSIYINSIIESRDALFDENHFCLIPRPKDIIQNVQESQMDDHTDDVPNDIHEPRKGKRVRKTKSYGFDFQIYLVEGSRDQVGSQYSYCYSIEEDSITYNEAMQSRDATFWKEAIDDEIGSIMKNNTWVLSDLPPGCKPLGCKWIFKRKMNVDGTIEKFKARLVIQGFRQKEGIDYFDTYAPVARITTIRLLLALAAIHNLVIHQMDFKTSFLNGDLDEEVYMKQLEGFVMPGNEHKVVCKLVKSFKFDNSGKGVIICLYVDDMLIFKTDQNQVDKTKKFLSSRFSMKDMGEANVILGIKIKRENKGIVITQSQYIEKILKKFNREDCSSLIRFTSNLSRQQRKAITRVFKYLTGTKDYGLSYVGYPSMLEGYSDASWINHGEDSSSTSGWVFLLRGGAILWASKKQTCITGSTMEYEFVEEVEWLRNLIHEISIWPKPIAPISI